MPTETKTEQSDKFFLAGCQVHTLKRMTEEDIRREVTAALQTEKDISGREYGPETVDELMKRYKGIYLK